MRQLNAVTLAWRNFMFTSFETSFEKENEIKEFDSRISIIQDSRESMLEELSKDNPDVELIKGCKEEIIFQKNELSELVNRFGEYWESECQGTNRKIIENEVLDSFSKGTESYFYQVVYDWQEYADYAWNVWENVSNECALEEISSSVQEQIRIKIIKEVMDMQGKSPWLEKAKMQLDATGRKIAGNEMPEQQVFSELFSDDMDISELQQLADDLMFDLELKEDRSEKKQIKQLTGIVQKKGKQKNR